MECKRKYNSWFHVNVCDYHYCGMDQSGRRKQKIHKKQKDTQHYLVCADYWKVISVVCFVNCKSGCYYDKLQRAPPTGEVLQDYKLGGNNAK